VWVHWCPLQGSAEPTSLDSNQITGPQGSQSGKFQKLSVQRHQRRPPHQESQNDLGYTVRPCLHKQKQNKSPFHSKPGLAPLTLSLGLNVILLSEVYCHYNRTRSAEKSPLWPPQDSPTCNRLMAIRVTGLDTTLMGYWKAVQTEACILGRSNLASEVITLIQASRHTPIYFPTR
jgi:hypothetical protein